MVFGGGPLLAGYTNRDFEDALIKQDGRIGALEKRMAARDLLGEVTGEAAEELRSKVTALEAVVKLQSDQISALTKKFGASSSSLSVARTPTSPTASVVSYVGPSPSAPQLSSSGCHISTNRHGYIEWVPFTATPSASMSMSIGSSNSVASPYHGLIYSPSMAFHTGSLVTPDNC